MIEDLNVDIIKVSGKKAKFSLSKLRSSLKKSGASDSLIKDILNTVRDELHQGISTKEIYTRAFDLLKKTNSIYASRYKLKKAIHELGPTGYPFERFVCEILKHSGFKAKTNIILQGKCVTHEVDVLATKNKKTTIVECKYHSDRGVRCNVKIPLYINSRYKDIKNHWDSNINGSSLTEGWLVTNTRFTADALQYGNCVGLYLLSWDFPKDNGLKDRIDRLRLYPITVSTLLSQEEIHHLLNENIVLCKNIINNIEILDIIGVSKKRQNKILAEIKSICNH